MNVNYEPLSTAIIDFAEQLKKPELVRPILDNQILDEKLAKKILVFINEMAQLCAELSNSDRKLDNNTEPDYDAVEKAYILIESNISEAGFDYILE